MLPVVVPVHGPSGGSSCESFGGVSVGFVVAAGLPPAEHPSRFIWDSSPAARAFAFKDHAAASVQLCLSVIKYSIIN